MNLAILRGVVVTEPVIQATPQRKVLKFKIVTSNGYHKITGARLRGELHQIVKWQKPDDDSEIVHYKSAISKGTMVTIVGKVTYNSWISKTDGQERHKTEIVARRISIDLDDVEGADDGDVEATPDRELDALESA